MTVTAEQLSYPIGRFSPLPATSQVRQQAIGELAALPDRLAEAIAGLNDQQLDTPYRPGGWTVRQVVHHVADSHMNGFIRTKLALTEETPTIKPYDEKAFSTLADARLPVAISLDLLRGLHARWVVTFNAMADTDWQRSFHHPEKREPQTVDLQLQDYAWHSRHHVAHITALRRRERW